mmetsp:Transcript_1830/g.3286  ORF Transcript_1830/g.3286 Transcript_1830/m.3286 type:complete len:98 (+) Transcript_1830:1031-1324(+)
MNDKSGSKFLPDSYSGNAIHTVRYGVSWFTSFIISRRKEAARLHSIHTLYLCKERRRGRQRMSEKEKMSGNTMKSLLLFPFPGSRNSAKVLGMTLTC